MTDTKDDVPDKLMEKLEALKEENLLLEEKLKLQRTNWLYSHRILLPIVLGILYGMAIAFIIYFLEYLLGTNFPNYVAVNYGLFLGLFLTLGIPVIAILPPIILLKAPRFTYGLLRSYLLSFLFFMSLILYIDPFCRWASGLQGIERVRQIMNVSGIQWLVAMTGVLFVPQIAARCGYRLVLRGSAFSFEVAADSSSVCEQLNKLEEDFNFNLKRELSDSKKAYFTRIYGKMKTILQFFLRPRENRTNVVLVMHNIENDVPMRAGNDEVSRIGRTIMTWLESSKNFLSTPIENKALVNEILQESEKSFYRQPIVLPSRKVVKEFLTGHWKDIVVIISLAVAVMSWLFPLR